MHPPPHHTHTKIKHSLTVQTEVGLSHSPSTGRRAREKAKEAETSEALLG